MRIARPIFIVCAVLLAGCSSAPPPSPSQSLGLTAGQRAIIASLSKDDAAWKIEKVDRYEVVIFRPAGMGIAGIAYVDSERGEVTILLVPTHENLRDAMARAKTYLQKNNRDWGEPQSIEFTGRSFRFRYPTSERETKLVGSRELDVLLGAGEPKELPRR